MLTITNISKTFNAGTVNEKHAMDNLSLTLNDGDFVTVIGGNGAGKSTLLNMIAGVFPCDRGDGSIVIDGIDVTRMPEHKRARLLGRVFQDPMRGTASDMGIEENLAMALRRGKCRGLRWGISDSERARYAEALAMLDLGLETRLNAKVGLLSGGQRQAITLLMSTLTRPQMLLLDEHTAALDPRTARKVLELTETIIERDRLTALMVTHNMKDAIRMGNRLVMMHEGRIILDIAGEQKKNLTVRDLLDRFESLASDDAISDRMLLTS